MGKTYDNEIVTEEVSLSIERVLIAPSTQTWTPARIDMDALPSGFSDLGATVEDSPTLTVTREKYQLKLGLPKSLQYEQIIGLDGEFGCVIYGKSNDLVAQALGVDVVTMAGGTRIAFGKTTIKKYHILGVADFVDGTQVVHDFPEVSVKGEYTENIRPEAPQLAFGFDCYSFLSTIHGGERIIGERFYFDAP